MESLTEIRRRFHQRPETCWTEFWTTAEICRYLESFGFTLMIGKEIIQENLRTSVPKPEVIDKWYQNAVDLGTDEKYLEKMKGGFTGVIGILDTKKHGPTIGFRADIDALPIQESKRKIHSPTKEGWASKYKGKMHACGHDVHLTIGLGVAKNLAQKVNSLKGKFIMIFSPAEEGGKGCVSINELPIIKEIQYILTNHCSTFPLGGDLFIAPKIFFRSVDLYNVEFSEKKGQIFISLDQIIEGIQEKQLESNSEKVNEIAKTLMSNPNRDNNALMAACTAIMKMKAIPRKPNGHSIVLMVNFKTGTKDIRPNPLSFDLIVRGDNDDIGNYIKQQALNICNCAAEMYDVKLKITRPEVHNYPAWNDNSPELINLAIKTWEEIGLKQQVITVPYGNLGSDDVIYIMKEIVNNGGKAIYIGLVSDDESGRMKNIHTNRFNIKDELLPAGVNLITRMIENLVERD